MKNNEIYYAKIANGSWTGDFAFEITSFGELIRSSAPAADKIWAIGLHTTLKAFKKATINTDLRGRRGRNLATSSGEVMLLLPPIARLDPIRIYLLRGRYRLAPDGTGVDVRMYEEWTPVPLLWNRITPAAARIGDGGLSAVYDLEMFGSRWEGVYTIDPATMKHVDVAYTSPWGRLTYNATKKIVGKVNDPPAPSPEAEALERVAAELEEAAERLRKKGDMMAVFTDVYVQATYALADVIDSPTFVITAEPRLKKGSFHDRVWVAKLGEAFVRRYAQALHGYETGGYVSDAWRPVFDAIRLRAVTELDALAMCMYAHIMGDLPHALAEARLLPNDGGRRLEDYDLVNEVFGRHIDEEQETVSDRYSTLYGWLDLLAGRLDEIFVDQRIRELRAVAWYTSERLMLSDPAARLAAEDFIARSVADFVSDLLDPDPPLAAAFLSVARSVVARLRNW